MFCLLTEELMLVKHIRSTVFGSASHFCCCFYLVCVGRAGGWRKCSLHHDWACLHQLFTVRHVLSNKGTVETGRGDWGLTRFTDLVLKQYFTNDLLNLNVHHRKRHWSKRSKLDLLEPQSFLGVGVGGGEP